MNLSSNDGNIKQNDDSFKTDKSMKDRLNEEAKIKA
jgi:hypothetical protein